MFFFFFVHGRGEENKGSPYVDEQKVNGIYGAARTLGWYSWKRSSTCSSFADLSHTSVDFIFEKAKIENEMVKKSVGFYFIWLAVEIES